METAKLIEFVDAYCCSHCPSTCTICCSNCVVGALGDSVVLPHSYVLLDLRFSHDTLPTNRISLTCSTFTKIYGGHQSYPLL
jgi:hypothetical protein